MANFYCENCGAKSSSVASLLTGTCFRHPTGANQGKHSLYQGSEKAQYYCKYCGSKSSSISGLSTGSCFRHPKGSYLGMHSPAL
jgi:hypothetical protein